MNQKEKIKNQRLLKTYGITLEEYNNKVQEQKGLCMICAKKPKTGLVVDHIHVPKYKELDTETKKEYVRGLLCNYCNKWPVGIIDRSLEGRKMLENMMIYFDIYAMKSDVI